MPKRDLYQATFSFGWQRQMLDVGQVIELAGLPNDGALVASLSRSATRQSGDVALSMHGAEFAADWQRTAHGDKRHRTRG